MLLALATMLSPISTGHAQTACSQISAAVCPNCRCRVTTRPRFGPLCVDQSRAPTGVPTQTACGNIVGANSCPDRCAIIQHSMFGPICLDPQDVLTTGAPTTRAPATQAPNSPAPPDRATPSLAAGAMRKPNPRHVENANPPNRPRVTPIRSRASTRAPTMQTPKTGFETLVLKKLF